MKYYIYIIYSKIRSKSYTGITNNLDRRLDEHNRKSSSVRWTKDTCDFEFVFCSQVEDRSTARLIELYLKSGNGRELKKKMIRRNVGS